MGCRGCLVTILVVLGVCVLLVVGCTGFFYTRAREVRAGLEEVDAVVARTETGTWRAPDRPVLGDDDIELWLRLRRQAAPHARRLAEATRAAVRADRDDVGFFEGLRTAVRLVKEIPMGYVEALEGAARAAEQEGVPFSRGAWIVRTAYGTLARAAEQGHEGAKALLDEIKEKVGTENVAGPGFEVVESDVEIGAKVFEQADRWVSEVDPATLERVLAHADDWTSSFEQVLVDLVVLEYEMRRRGEMPPDAGG